MTDVEAFCSNDSNASVIIGDTLRIVTTETIWPSIIGLSKRFHCSARQSILSGDHRSRVISTLAWLILKKYI
jgi:hypothetical protein